MDAATREEIDGLRQQVAALSASVRNLRRVSLREVEGARFLGQPATLIASVADAATGAPAIGESLTLTTTWGRLRWVEGVVVQEGSSVIARTDAVGSVRVTLRPDPAEDLLAAQEAALATTLATLDAGSPKPADVVEALREMVRLYRWEANVGFRRAVDVYVRDFGRGVLEAINAWDAMAVWRTIPATVAAHAVSQPEGHEGVTDTTGSAVRGAAMVTMTFLDWVAPWLRTYEQEVMSDGSLRQRLQDLTALGDDPGRLLEVAYERVRESIAFEPGRLGALIAPRAGRAAMRGFVDDGISDLSIDTRAQLVPAASAVSDAVGEGTIATAGAITQSRTDLSLQIEASASTVDASVATARQDLGSRIDGKADAQDLEGIRSQLATTAQDVQGFKGQIAEIDTLRSQLAANTRDLEVFRGQIGEFQNIRSQVETNAQDLAGIHASLDANATQLRDMQTRVQSLNTDVTTRFDSINGRILDINKHIGRG